MKGGGGMHFRKHYGQSPDGGKLPPRDVWARCSMAVACLGQGEGAGGPGPSRTVGAATASTEGALRGKQGVPSLPEAGAPRGDQWERPVADLGVHHMVWPADMQCCRERHCASPQAACEPKGWPPNPNPNLPRPTLLAFQVT